VNLYTYLKIYLISNLISAAFHASLDFCCSATSAETGDDAAHFQATSQSLRVPHLMRWRTEVTFTTARRCCGVSVPQAPHTKLQAYLLTYLLKWKQNQSDRKVASFVPCPLYPDISTAYKHTDCVHVTSEVGEISRCPRQRQVSVDVRLIADDQPHSKTTALMQC